MKNYAASLRPKSGPENTYRDTDYIYFPIVKVIKTAISLNNNKYIESWCVINHSLFSQIIAHRR